ncbi:terpene synthase family protein [Streptomyces sp. NPDC049555]|uniref:terpene synthase family protein n=1 Tax=Streptomyces sp. NPDC049555 TaxID=3154930 RepID=UPI00344AF9ED
MTKPLLFPEVFDGALESVSAYRAPVFTAPFPTLLNPHHQYAQQAALAWAHRHGLGRTPAARQRLTDMECGTFSGLYCPRTDREGAVVMAQWIIWLFLWDDTFDDGPSGRDLRALQQALGPVDRALADPPDPQDPSLTHPLARALADLWRTIHARAPQVTRRRFPESVRIYLRAVAEETRNRAADTVPDLDSYLRLRRINGATRSSIDLLEILQGVEVPDALRHGLYGELRAFASELWLWSNDTFTVLKDLHYRNPHNLVLVLRAARGLPLQEAADQAVHMVEQRLRDFAGVAHRLRTLVDMPRDPHAGARHEVLKAVGMLEDAISGYFRWQETTARYRRTSGFLTP